MLEKATVTIRGIIIKKKEKKTSHLAKRTSSMKMLEKPIPTLAECKQTLAILFKVRKGGARVYSRMHCHAAAACSSHPSPFQGIISSKKKTNKKKSNEPITHCESAEKKQVTR